MTTHQTRFLSELSGDEPISEGTLAYLGARAKDRLYDYVIKKFMEKEKDGFTRADLARKIGKRPEVITRYLGSPGNWTIETISHLLAGICAEELEPYSVSFLNRSPRNYTGDEWLHELGATSNPSNTVIVKLAGDQGQATTKGTSASAGRILRWNSKNG